MTGRDSLDRRKALRHLLVVSREHFRVVLYRRPALSTRFKVVRRYRCAIGDIGHATPAGVFVISAKSDRPEWRAPDSEWVPEAIRGRVFKPGDPENPIVGAFLAIWDGVGIHGTHSLESLGTAASHGCIRVTPEAALELYRRVPAGTPCVVI